MKTIQILVSVLLGLLAFSGWAQNPILNPSFEDGYNNWTSDLATWGPAPVTQNSLCGAGFAAMCAAPDGSYYADNYDYGQTSATGGLLRSTPFILDQNGIAFDIAGWAGHFVKVRRTSDNSLVNEKDISITQAAFRTENIACHEAVGQSVYIEAELKGGLSGQWTAIDNFRTVDLGPQPTPTPTPLPNPIPNFSFEDNGGSLDHWTVTGVAFGSDAVNTSPFGPAKDGQWYAISLPDEVTGTLRSETFTLNSEAIGVWTQGWSLPGIAVRLMKASDNSVIYEKNLAVTTPGWNPSNDLTLLARGKVGTQVYLEVVDNESRIYPPIGGWMAVDYFRPVPFDFMPAGGVTENGNFELGDYTAWTATGAFGILPQQTNGVVPPDEGHFCASSLTPPGPGAGTLVSSPFIMQGTGVEFLMAGFAEGVYVELCRASDDAVLDLQEMPETTHLWRPRVLSAPEATGQLVYIRCVDDYDDPSRATPWLAVDDFHFGGIPPTPTPTPTPPPSGVDGWQTY